MHSLALLLAGLAAMPITARAQPPERFSAHYVITMTHVTVGELTWTTNFTETSYLASATGKASGVLSVLVKGEGSLTTRGAFENAKLTPAVARFDVSDDDGVYEVEMTFEGGVYKRVVDRGAPPPKDIVPVGPKLLHDVIDPLSAFLIPVEGKALAPANCGKVLKIFDGRRRYDLALSFKRMDAVKLARGYSGPVLVCGVVLHPIAGYRPGSLLVRYLAGKDDLELWLAPIAGVSILAPVRALMPTLVGTMDISADEFVERKLEQASPKPVDVTPAAPATPVEAAPLAPATQPVESAPLDPVKP
jgi:uncharacterized protein DUF3108